MVEPVNDCQGIAACTSRIVATTASAGSTRDVDGQTQ